MFWRYLAFPIQRDWQTELDTSLEAGQTPLLDLGSSQQMLRGLPVLAALRTFVTQRRDVTAPILLIGGNAALWLALLFQVRSPAETRRSPEPTIVFAGADLPTYMASLTTLTPERSPETALMPHATPPMLRPLFVPFTPAQMASPWESLALGLAEEAQATNAVALRSGAMQNDEWLSWLAIGLVVILLLLALVT